MGKLGKKIKVAESRMVQHQEEYLENVLNNAEHSELEQGGVAQSIPEANQQMQQVAQPVTPAPQQTLAQPAAPIKAKKTENGIVINVPMADYMQLTMMKIQTGRTLKDLALQAIHEFVERNAQQ